MLLIAVILVIFPVSADADAGSDLNKKDDSWIADPANRGILENMLTYQTPSGGWAKSYDSSEPRDEGRGRSGYGDWNGSPTIDNGATFSEVRVCARVLSLGTDGDAFREAALRGLDFLLEAQYASGGWPQCPARYADDPDSYRQLVTFNDNAMVGVMRLLRDAAAGEPPFQFVDPERRARARDAFERGVDFIVKSQIRSGGRLTGWCQQHDPVSYAPAQGRSYEPPAIAGGESSKIVLLLIEIEDPDARVSAAIEAAATWFESARLSGKRLVKEADSRRVLVDDPSAPPLWARMYDIASNRPIFVERDGTIHASISELSADRSGGYDWIASSWGNDVAKRYERWKKAVKKT